MFPPRDISNVLNKCFNIKSNKMSFRESKYFTKVYIYTNRYSKGQIKIKLNGKIYNLYLIPQKY